MRRDAPLPVLARRLLVAAVLLLAGAAIGQDAGEETPEEPPEPAALRVLHLSPDAPLVDVLIDGRLALRDVGHRVRTDYVSVPAGRHEVRVYPHRLPERTEGEPAAGAAPPAGEEDGPDADPADAGAEDAGEAEDEDASGARPLEPVVALVDLAPGSYTTVVLTGHFEAPVGEGGLGHLSIAVDPPDAHVTVRGPRGYLAQRRGEQLLSDLEPGSYEVEVRQEGYQTAQYQVEVRPGGTAVATLSLQAADDEDADAQGPALLQEQTAGTWQRLELQPYQGDLPLPGAGRTLVRFVHVAPSVPHLGISLRSPVTDPNDGEGAEDAADDAGEPVVWLDRLSYPNAADYQTIAAGPYRLEFRVAGTDSVLHAVPALEFRAGATYTLYLSGDPEGGRIDVVPVVDAYLPQRPPPAEEP